MSFNAEKLTTSGVMLAAGFGVLPKAAMLDREVLPNGKTLYACFCAYAGKDGKVPVRRDNQGGA
jgi:hypothetical protein